MRLTPARSLLLALVLIFGQWLVLAHASEHPAVNSDVSCELCLHVHHLGAGLPTTSPTITFPTTHATPPDVATPTPRSTFVSHYPIRGPPAIS